MRESERRRQLRINQARERANDLTRVVRQRVQREQFRLVKKIGTEELEKYRSQKLTELSRLQNEYQDALNDFGIGHDGANEQFKYEKLKAKRAVEQRDLASIRGQHALKGKNAFTGP